MLEDFTTAPQTEHKTFYRYLTESADMLDISIKAADKYLTTESKIQSFLNGHCVINAKTDGVKLTVLKIDDKGNLSDWIFAYKGHILYPGEFDWQPKAKINAESVGASQFQKVFDHFNKIGKNFIPVGTELQCEFLMRKNTLSSNYKHPHGIVLIQHAKSTYDENAVKFGKLKTKPTAMGTDHRDAYAKALKINVPLVLFDGILGTRASFERGILWKDLKSAYEAKKTMIDWDNPVATYQALKEIFLSVESVFGGKEEGVIITFDNGLILKWQQSYQLDQKARALIKMKYKDDNPETENEYWVRVKEAAYTVCEGIGNTIKLEDATKKLSNAIRSYKLTFKHSKKTDAQIRDDIQLTAKTLLIKRMKGNNGCLVLGKFRVFTNGHKKVVETALKEFDRVCICLVTSSDTKATQPLRLKALKKLWGNNNRIEIVEFSGGNLIRIFEKATFNINAVYTGTDRVETYTKQLNGSIGMSVQEIKRTASDISATKVIDGIENRKFFEDNVPKELHSMYNEYYKAYKK